MRTKTRLKSQVSQYSVEADWILRTFAVAHYACFLCNTLEAKLTNRQRQEPQRPSLILTASDREYFIILPSRLQACRHSSSRSCHLLSDPPTSSLVSCPSVVRSNDSAVRPPSSFNSTAANVVPATHPIPHPLVRRNNESRPNHLPLHITDRA